MSVEFPPPVTPPPSSPEPPPLQSGPPVKAPVLSDSEAADRALLATPTRQAPLAVVFMLIKFVRNLGFFTIFAAIAFLTSGQVPVWFFGVAPFVALVILAALLASWWRFVFCVQVDELVVAKGIVSQERLSIPLDRIQSISIEQKFLHRLIGLVSISVDTAGSDEAELRVDAIDKRRADALQRLAAGRQPAAGATASGLAEADDSVATSAAASPIDQVLVHRTPMQLVKIGLSRWPWAGLVVLGPLLALGTELVDFVPGDRLFYRYVAPRAAELTRASEDFDGSIWLVAGGIAVVLGFLAVGALFGALLQLVQTLVTEWDLRLVRTSTGLRRTAGLLSKTSKASTVTRIQRFSTRENPIERRLGIRRLSLPTIGDGDLTIPGVTDDEQRLIRAEVFGDLEQPVLDQKVSPASWRLSVRNTAIAAAVVTLPLAYFVSPWWALGLVLIPIEFVIEYRRWRLRRWGICGDAVGERLAFVGQTKSELPLYKTQSARVTQSFSERRRGLATVRIDAAEGHIEIPMIELAVAERVRDLALWRAETEIRPWM